MVDAFLADGLRVAYVAFLILSHKFHPPDNSLGLLKDN